MEILLKVCLSLQYQYLDLILFITFILLSLIAYLFTCVIPKSSIRFITKESQPRLSVSLDSPSIVAQEEFPQNVILWIQDLTGDEGEKTGSGGVTREMGRNGEGNSSNERDSDMVPGNDDQQVRNGVMLMNVI